MKLFSIVRATFALAFFVFTAQSAAALTCSARTGSSGGDYAAQVFVNATTDVCEYSPSGGDPNNDGHYISVWGVGVNVYFYEDGSLYEPTSKSLTCSGASTTAPLYGRISVLFPSNVFETSCSISYTDPNGQVVSHSFGAHTELVFHAILGQNVGLGFIDAFSVTTGWFERVSPTVSVALPAEISGPTSINAAITFSETVTGFTANEVTVSGGTVTNLSGSGANYVAAITPTGTEDLIVLIAADVAQDLAGNDNLASSSETAVNVTAADTSELTAQFMLNRANALLANQPDLARFLRGGAGHFNAEANNEGGNVSFDSGYDAPIWAQLNANWSTSLGAESSYLFGVIGAHSKLSENFLVGGMMQFDSVTETNGAATTSGTGWLIGPYFAAKLAAQPLYIDGSILYGQTHNLTSPFGTFTDTFSTERWLATFGVSGQIEKANYTLVPFLDAQYTEDSQAGYVDGIGNTIGAQTVALGQVSAGLDVSIPVGTATTLSAGASGIWSFSSGSTEAPGFEGGRARVDVGVSHILSGAGTVNLSSYYDGLGTPDFESFGFELIWQHEF